MISIGGKRRKRVKKNIFDAQKPPKGVSSNFGSAAVLSATWWDLSEWLVGPDVCQSRNQRFAARLRGALATLRKQHGEDAVLLLPLYLPHRNDILDALNALPKQEKISLNTTSPEKQEEE